ncbi:MAG: peptidase, partial [Oenococcus sp.]
MALTVAIDTDVLAHYVTNSHVQLGTLKHKVKNINLFLEGNKQPTFNQVSDIAKAINIPTGLLLLSQPIELITDKTKFRTANSEPIMDMSDELRDTILEIESKQDFLRNEIEEVLTFVGQYSLETNKNEIIST